MNGQTNLANEGVLPICEPEMDYAEDAPPGTSEPYLKCSSYYACSCCGRGFDALSGKELRGGF